MTFPWVFSDNFCCNWVQYCQVNILPGFTCQCLIPLLLQVKDGDRFYCTCFFYLLSHTQDRLGIIGRNSCPRWGYIVYLDIPAKKDVSSQKCNVCARNWELSCCYFLPYFFEEPSCHVHMTDISRHLLCSFFLSSLTEVFLLITVFAVSSLVFISCIKRCKVCLKISDTKALSDRFPCNIFQKMTTLHLCVCGKKLMNNSGLTSVQI